MDTAMVSDAATKIVQYLSRTVWF